MWSSGVQTISKESIIVALTLCISTGGFARLGDTKAESESRYGAPKKYTGIVSTILEGAETLSYEYEGWRIRAAYLDSKTVKIQYTKMSNKENDLTIHNDEFQIIMRAESGGEKWIKKRMPLNPFEALKVCVQMKKIWLTKSGRIAYLFGTDRILVIELPVATEHIEKLKAEKEYS